MLRVVVPECGPDFKLFFFVRVVIVVRTLQCESSKAGVYSPNRGSQKKKKKKTHTLDTLWKS